jgi:hypothetical protein
MKKNGLINIVHVTPRTAAAAKIGAAVHGMDLSSYVDGLLFEAIIGDLGPELGSALECLSSDAAPSQSIEEPLSGNLESEESDAWSSARSRVYVVIEARARPGTAKAAIIRELIALGKFSKDDFRRSVDEAYREIGKKFDSDSGFRDLEEASRAWWSELRNKQKMIGIAENQDLNDPFDSIAGPAPDVPASDADGIDRKEAERVCAERMQRANIPAHSTTARCMFEATTDSQGRNRCRFGETPLWGKLADPRGIASRTRFMEFVDRLIKSGQDFQAKGRRSHGKS